MVKPHTLFIADLHLSAERADITSAFLQFLQQDAVQADALYILGDLFEVWIGDDNPEPLLCEVASQLKQLSQQVPVYFIHGNRDFLLRERYAKSAGMQLLPAHKVIELYGTPTLIMHGDSLCTADIKYQKFRRWWDQRWWQNLMLSLPLWYRQRLAKKARHKSAAYKATLSGDANQIMDVTPEEVVRVMEEAGVRHLIHGHTHRPKVHQVPLAQGTGQRYVLGDWYQQASYLKVSADDWQLFFQDL